MAADYAQRRKDTHRLATLLANTRPDDEGTEGEWALRLYEAGIRPPAPPHPAREDRVRWLPQSSRHS